MLASDLKVEYLVQGLLKKTMKLCEGVQDYKTRNQLAKLLYDTEEDHPLAQQQLRLIKMMGLENYIQSHLGDGGQGQRGPLAFKPFPRSSS